MDNKTIHDTADKIKALIRAEASEMKANEAELACTAVDCFAAILVKITLIDGHLERIADCAEKFKASLS